MNASVCIDGGLDEVVEEMNGGKVLYAFLRVIDPNTELPKNVLINWVWYSSDRVVIEQGSLPLFGNEIVC